MRTNLIIILFAFFKSIADVIKVPQVFNSSIFAKFKGVQWIDPLVTPPEPDNFFLSLIVAPFRDLWHTCQSGMILCLFALPFVYVYSLNNDKSYWSKKLWLYPVMWAFVYYVSFEWLWLRLWIF